MAIKTSNNPEEQNQDAYDDLIVSIEAARGNLSLLIAVCDREDFRNEIITRYETELQPDFRSYRITLQKREPSLNAAIKQLVEQEEYLRNSQSAIITVTGIQQLYFLKLGEEQSEQDKFFGYLQWTREALRKYPFAIVLWVTNQILVNLVKKAPDFWSWRSGVFHFVSKAKNFVDVRELEPIRFALEDTELASFDDNQRLSLPTEDLQRLIQQIEQQSGAKDRKLATLYVNLANIYVRRLDRGEADDYQKEQDLAIEYYCKAIEMQKELGLEVELATSLNNLAYIYRSQGRFAQAEPLYQQALELRKRILGENHFNYGASLNNLAALYYSQGRFNEAEPLYQQALELRKRILGENHLNYGASLNNLALLYYSQGRFNEAEPLFQQALQLAKHILGENHPKYATSLDNLAQLYHSQGCFEEAEPLYQQALELRKHILAENHPSYATSLNNLASIYDYQGRYDEAEALCQQALELRKRILSENHPDYAESLNNLAGLYQSQGRFEQAEPLYQQALEIYDRALGEDHPRTVTVRQNLESLQREMNDE